MSLFGAILVGTFGDKEHLKKAQKRYATDVLVIGEKGEKADPKWWTNKYSQNQLAIVAKVKEKKNVVKKIDPIIVPKIDQPVKKKETIIYHAKFFGKKNTI